MVTEFRRDYILWRKLIVPIQSGTKLLIWNNGLMGDYLLIIVYINKQQQVDSPLLTTQFHNGMKRHFSKVFSYKV